MTESTTSNVPEKSPELIQIETILGERLENILAAIEKAGKEIGDEREFLNVLLETGLKDSLSPTSRKLPSKALLVESAKRNPVETIKNLLQNGIFIHEEVQDIAIEEDLRAIYSLYGEDGIEAHRIESGLFGYSALPARVPKDASAEDKEAANQAIAEIMKENAVSKAIYLEDEEGNDSKLLALLKEEGKFPINAQDQYQEIFEKEKAHAMVKITNFYLEYGAIPDEELVQEIITEYPNSIAHVRPEWFASEEGYRKTRLIALHEDPDTIVMLTRTYKEQPITKEEMLAAVSPIGKGRLINELVKIAHHIEIPEEVMFAAVTGNRQDGISVSYLVNGGIDIPEAVQIAATNSSIMALTYIYGSGNMAGINKALEVSNVINHSNNTSSEEKKDIEAKYAEQLIGKMTDRGIFPIRYDKSIKDMMTELEQWAREEREWKAQARLNSAKEELEWAQNELSSAKEGRNPIAIGIYEKQTQMEVQKRLRLAKSRYKSAKIKLESAQEAFDSAHLARKSAQETLSRQIVEEFESSKRKLRSAQRSFKSAEENPRLNQEKFKAKAQDELRSAQGWLNLAQETLESAQVKYNLLQTQEGFKSSDDVEIGADLDKEIGADVDQDATNTDENTELNPV